MLRCVIPRTWLDCKREREAEADLMDGERETDSEESWDGWMAGKKE